MSATLLRDDLIEKWDGVETHKLGKMPTAAQTALSSLSNYVIRDRRHKVI